MNSKRYTIALLIAFLIMLTVVPLLNWVVDPFWYFRNVEVNGFNLIKPSYHQHEREVKSALVSKLRPEVIILGSSFAEIGLPTTHPGLTDEGRHSAFNLALPWAQGAELYCYELFSLAQPAVKRLVIGGFDLAEHTCDKYPHLGEVDYPKLLLSKTAFAATLDTLRNQDGRQMSTADGMWSFISVKDEARTDEYITRAFTDSFQGILCDAPQRNRGLAYARIDRSLPPADATTAGLRKLIRLARERHVQLILIDFPKHVLYYEQQRECGGLEAYLNRLWRIAAVIEQEAGADSRQVELWSFYAYQDINAERVRAGIPLAQRLWLDAGHFYPGVGTAAFDSIFGAKTAFGHRVTTGGFDRFVAEVEQNRQAFLIANPWVYQEMDALRQAARGQPGGKQQEKP